MSFVKGILKPFAKLLGYDAPAKNRIPEGYEAVQTGSKFEMQNFGYDQSEWGEVSQAVYDAHNKPAEYDEMGGLIGSKTPVRETPIWEILPSKKAPTEPSAPAAPSAPATPTATATTATAPPPPPPPPPTPPAPPAVVIPDTKVTPVDTPAFTANQPSTLVQQQKKITAKESRGRGRTRPGRSRQAANAFLGPSTPLGPAT
jgi:hypothetical protein